MPDPSTSLRASRDSAEFSRVCPKCGRRVPRNVDVCRCGAALPAAAAAPVEATANTGGQSTLLIALVVLVIAVAGGGYWFVKRPATTKPDAARATETTAGPANAAAPVESAQARAWNAAANAKDIAPTDKTDTSRLPPPPAAPAASIEEMVDRVMPAVVLIETTTGRGSGFFVASDTLITNVHVVQNDAYVTLRRLDGSSVSARVAAKAPTYDLAVLKVAQPLPTQAVIPMGSTRALRPGQEIIVIGSALGTLQNSVSRGIVSGLRNAGGATVVQTDAAVNPGNSGGPMLDRTGAVVGITTMKYSNAEGLNFGVAIDHARDLLEGRLADLGTQSGLNQIATQGQARQSESDRLQQQGEVQFKAQIGEFANAARKIDGDWQQYRKQCFSAAIPGTYDHEWFAVLAGAMPANAGAGCTAYYGQLEGEIKQFRDLMKTTLGDARRASVLPGTMRDALRQNRLDFEWDR